MLASVKIVPETDRTTRPTQLESVISVSCVIDASYARLARAVLLVDSSDSDEVEEADFSPFLGKIIGRLRPTKSTVVNFPHNSDLMLKLSSIGLRAP